MPMDKSYSLENEALLDYVDQTFHPEDEVLKSVREGATKAGLPPIQVGKFDALHLEVIARASKATKIVEIGTLGGYSGIALARALPKEGLLYTLEIEKRNATFAEESFKRAGLSDKARVLLGPALDSLESIENEGPFDLVFIDADKLNYPKYFEWAVSNLRVGGVILGDNTFAWGQIASTEYKTENDRDTIGGLQEFNKRMGSDPRLRSTILPTGEGLTMGVKISE